MSSVVVTLAGGRSTTVSRALCSSANRQFSDALDMIDVLSAGLDAGYAVGLIIIFFCLQYPRNGTIGLNTIQAWWGNTVYINTGDFAGVPDKVVPDGGTFGPSTW